ncbi:MAG: S1C family serine protease, partial [Candidatus Dormibacteria bacterium]
GGGTLGGIAADRSPSVVSIFTQPPSADDLISGTVSFANGFVAGPDGLIVTTARAVEGATQLRVATADGHAFDALVAGSDRRHGLVVLRAAGARDLSPVPFASRSPRPGDFGLVVARPSLRGPSIAPGTVSSAGGSLEGGAEPVADSATLSAPGGSGEEGAPLLDDRGAAIGVVTHQPGASTVTSELMVLSARAAADLVERVGRGGSINRPSLGVDSMLLVPATAAAAGLPAGALIRTVTAGSPAAEAGIARGDIVTAADGTAIDGDHPLDAVALRLDPGRRVILTVATRGNTRNVAVTVGSE